MKIIDLEKIKAVLPSLDLLPAIEEGFAAYSEGDAVVPPVGELLLDEGEVHIKYGYLKGHDHYVIKIASGFYGNPQIGFRKLSSRHEALNRKINKKGDSYREPPF